MAGLFGDLMNPKVPGAVPTPAAPAGGAGAPNLEGSWREYLSNPTIQAGLLQFGLNMMSPAQPGQGFGGQLAGGIAAAGGAMGRVEERNIALEDRDLARRTQEAETGLKTRDAAVRERGAAAQEDANKINREQLFHQSVTDSPEHVESVEAAKLRAQLGSGAVTQGLTPAQKDWAFANVPDLILGGQKISDGYKNALILAAIEYGQDKTSTYIDQVTGRQNTQIIKGQPLPPNVKSALQAIGAQLPEAVASPTSRVRGEAPEEPSLDGGGINIGEIAGRGQLGGPVSAALQLIGRTPLINMSTAQTQEIEQGRKALELRTGALVRALSTNPRFAEGERQQIRDDLDLDPKLWDSPGAVVPRLKAIDDQLVRLKQAAERDLKDPNLDPEEEIHVRGVIRAVNNFRVDFLPVARADTPEQQQEMNEYIQNGQIPPGTPIMYKNREGVYVITKVPQPNVQQPTAPPGAQPRAPAIAPVAPGTPASKQPLPNIANPTGGE